MTNVPDIRGWAKQRSVDSGSQEYRAMTNTAEAPAKLIQSVRRHRGMAGLSQQQLADRIGVARKTIDEIETGCTVPGIDIALEIARELQLPVESLFALNRGRK